MTDPNDPYPPAERSLLLEGRHRCGLCGRRRRCATVQMWGSNPARDIADMYNWNRNPEHRPEWWCRPCWEAAAEDAGEIIYWRN